MSDVDIEGIVVGQGIQWDGTRWIPLTISSSGGTATDFVDNEVVSGSGTSFTLANAPIAGSVKLHGRGQRLKVTTDYSITGSAITTVDSWAAGDLIADYRK